MIVQKHQSVIAATHVPLPALLRHSHHAIRWDHLAPAQPLFELRRDHRGIHAQSRFQQTVAGRQRFVEGAHAGEMAHEEVIQPVERAGPANALLLDLDAQFAGEHRTSIARLW
jgi:hypothetical protein